MAWYATAPEAVDPAVVAVRAVGRTRGLVYDTVERTGSLGRYVELTACRAGGPRPGPARYDDGCDGWLWGPGGLVAPGDRAAIVRALGTDPALGPAALAWVMLAMRPDAGDEDYRDPRERQDDCPAADLTSLPAARAGALHVQVVARSPPSSYAMVLDVTYDAAQDGIAPLTISRWSCRRAREDRRRR